MLKIKHWLIGRESTCITDCSRLIQLFETDFEATHTIQRWKLELLRFDFTIVHRPAKMFTECDMLLRYNTWISEWEKERPPSPEVTKPTSNEIKTGTTLFSTMNATANTPTALLATFATSLHTAPQIPQSHITPQIIGPDMTERTVMAEVCDSSCTLWILGQGAEKATAAMDQLGITPLVIHTTDEEAFW